MTKTTASASPGKASSKAASKTASRARTDTPAPSTPTEPPAKAAKPSSTPNMPAPATKADAKLASAWKSKSGRELTEAELLAMPDSEYMNDKQLEFFRTRLDAQKEDLLSNAGETTEHLREDTSIEIGRAHV